MERYNHNEIENKWQKHWEDTGLFNAGEKSNKEKYYILDMFPYPSGAGLHVGHPEGYTATDIIAKYKMMKGYAVLHPMGWDAFGLPAENYAIKTGVHPKESTQQNIETFRRQIKSLGFGYDWSREINTSDPEYFKWTQWFFGLLYKNKLAYKKEAPVNWCDSCKTVLANEQVVSGACERCGGQVTQRKLSQWFFKITNFADQLIEGLDDLDWPESLKQIQRNWIGKSHGAQITFQLKDSQEVLDVYTTRPDTLFGVTYMVVAPEHPVIDRLEASIKNLKEVVTYRKRTEGKTDLERSDASKTKSGVELSGISATHPITGEEIPVFISDYVLMSYGTGAIMAVPGHDQRDYEFAQKYELPIKEVIEGGDISQEAFDGEGAVINSEFLNGLSSSQAKQRMIEYLEDEGIGYGRVQYKLRDWLISRQRYWGAPIPIVYDDQGDDYLIPQEELPVELPDDVDFRPTGQSPLVDSGQFHNKKDLKRIEDALKASGELDQSRTIVKRESDTMDTFVCSSWYFFRYVDPKNDKEFADPKKIKEWLPVDTYVGGVEHAVLHLLYARFFTKVLQQTGHIDFDEPFLQLRNQGLILGGDGEKMSKSRGNVVNPDDIIKEFGADTLRCYEMFMGPFEDSKPWDTNGVQGVRRFLEKAWRNTEKISDEKKESWDDIVTLMHQSIKKVTESITGFRFNTAISQLMIFNNKIAEEGASKEMFETFVILLSPFAPHIAEELWAGLGHTGSVFEQEWPEFDPQRIVESVIELPIQVNGKVRSKIMIASDAGEDEVKEKALADEKIKGWLEGNEPKKVIYVPNRIVNIIL